MRINKKLTTEVNILKSMSRMVQAYQEIAAMRMRKVRNSVLQNREFLDGLNVMYGNVSKIYRQTLPFYDSKKRKYSGIRKTNGKTVSVLLSANTGLYGSIIRQTFDLFLQDVLKNDTDVVIVGKYGKKFYESSELNKPFEYFDFSDSGLDEENSKKILEYVLQYENVVTYHGFFKNILQQVAKSTALLGEVPASSASDEANAPKFLFEPSIEEVVSFFEKEIMSSIFEQSVYEMSLSKFASRMIYLDHATVNVKNRMRKTDFNVRKMKHKLANSNQLNLLSSMSLWGY